MQCPKILLTCFRGRISVYIVVFWLFSGSTCKWVVLLNPCPNVHPFSYSACQRHDGEESGRALEGMHLELCYFVKITLSKLIATVAFVFAAYPAPR